MLRRLIPLAGGAVLALAMAGAGTASASATAPVAAVHAVAHAAKAAPPPCAEGYSVYADGGNYEIQGHGLGVPVTTTTSGNCWHQVAEGGGLFLLQNGDGNCLSWWVSDQRFVLADPSCSGSSDNQLFYTDGSGSLGTVLANVKADGFMSAFTLSNGSELGYYGGGPIANDEWIW